MLVRMTLKEDGSYTVVNIDVDKYGTLTEMCEKADIEVEPENNID